jgi:RimJ/RimL family protein N-acetyltransferase
MSFHFPQNPATETDLPADPAAVPQRLAKSGDNRSLPGDPAAKRRNVVHPPFDGHEKSVVLARGSARQSRNIVVEALGARCDDRLVTQATLQTDRIKLVPLSGEHVELEVELDSDPEVMRYLTGRGRTREQVMAAHQLRLATAESVPGLGFWVGFVDEQFVGWWLLEPPGWAEQRPVEGQAELGYRLLRRYWRQGYASEGSRELLRHALEDLGLHRVSAQTMTVNTGSRATMAAVGLQYIRTFHDDGDKGFADSELGGVEYAITRDEWRAANLEPNA